MVLTKLILAVSEFGLSLFLSIFVVYWCYRSFCHVTADYDVEEAIRGGNVAVAIEISALMGAAAVIMHQTVYPVVSIVMVWLTGRGEEGHSLPRMAAYAAGHILFGFLVSVAVVEGSLRFFEKLSGEIEEDAEIRKGNAAVAVVMAAVILVLSGFMRQGVGALNKSLIPQPRLGSLSGGAP